MFSRMWVARRKPMMSTAPITSVSAVPRPAVTSWRRRSVPVNVIPYLSIFLLGQLESHPGPHRHLDRGPIDEHRRVAPVLHGVDRGLVEHPGWYGLDDVNVARLAALIDGEFQRHEA